MFFFIDILWNATKPKDHYCTTDVRRKNLHRCNGVVAASGWRYSFRVDWFARSLRFSSSSVAGLSRKRLVESAAVLNPVRFASRRLNVIIAVGEWNRSKNYFRTIEVQENNNRFPRCCIAAGLS